MRRRLFPYIIWFHIFYTYYGKKIEDSNIIINNIKEKMRDAVKHNELNEFVNFIISNEDWKEYHSVVRKYAVLA